MKRLLGFWVLLIWMIEISPAAAKTINAQTAASQRTDIPVEVGIGHTIDFSDTDERIFRAWIGDGGRCLLLSGSSPLEAGAAILNLRRISPCQAVTGLPAVERTVLTLATLDAAGNTTIYEFSISYGATGESLTRIVTASEQPVTPVQRAALNVASVQSGLASFNLDEGSPLAARVEQWVAAVNGGMGQRLAAQTEALDWALLERLESVGNRNALLQGAVGP